MPDEAKMYKKIGASSPSMAPRSTSYEDFAGIRWYGEAMTDDRAQLEKFKEAAARQNPTATSSAFRSGCGSW